MNSRQLTLVCLALIVVFGIVLVAIVVEANKQAEARINKDSHGYVLPNGSGNDNLEVIQTAPNPIGAFSPDGGWTKYVHHLAPPLKKGGELNGSKSF